MRRIPLAIFALTLTVLILVCTLLICSYDVNFYQNFFIEQGINKATEMSLTDLNMVAEHLVAYLQGNVETIQVKAIVAGQLRNVFTEREILHIQDVKQLFDLTMIIGLGAFALCLISGIYLYKKKDMQSLALGLHKSFMISLIMVITLLLLSKLDFYRYFTIFHEMLFSNDLWLLDPQKHILIKMLPLPFFSSIVQRILLWFSLVMISLEIIARLLLKKGYTYD